MNNWQEWIYGICPTNCLSALRLLSASPTGTNVTIYWQSVAGVNYFLERSANLGSALTAREGQPAQAGQWNSHLRRRNGAEPATQSLTFDGSLLTWLSRGTSPGVWRATLEVSNNGTNWLGTRPLGRRAGPPGGLAVDQPIVVSR